MNRFIKLFVVLIFSIPCTYASSVEHEDDHDEIRVDHYVAEEPENIKDALALLDDKVSAIETLLGKQKLDIPDLEGIHQVTYSLEAAVDYLMASGNENREEALDDLDEAVQAIHHASEDREEDEIREWFVELKIRAEKVKALY